MFHNKNIQCVHVTAMQYNLRQSITQIFTASSPRRAELFNEKSQSQGWGEWNLILCCTLKVVKAKGENFVIYDFHSVSALFCVCARRGKSFAVYAMSYREQWVRSQKLLPLIIHFFSSVVVVFSLFWLDKFLFNLKCGWELFYGYKSKTEIILCNFWMVPKNFPHQINFFFFFKSETFLKGAEIRLSNNSIINRRMSNAINFLLLKMRDVWS